MSVLGGNVVRSKSRKSRVNIVAITNKSRTPTNTFKFLEYALEIFSGEMQVLHLINKDDLSYVVMGFHNELGWVNLSDTGCTGISSFEQFDQYRLDTQVDYMIDYSGDYCSMEFELELSKRLIKLMRNNKAAIMSLYSGEL